MPSSALICSADGNFEVTLATKATIYSQGLVEWKPPAIYKSSCEIDVEYFPFDEQTCVLKFGSWTYDGFKVRLPIRPTNHRFHLRNGPPRLLFIPYFYLTCALLFLMIFYYLFLFFLSLFPTKFFYCPILDFKNMIITEAAIETLSTMNTVNGTTGNFFFNYFLTFIRHLETLQFLTSFFVLIYIDFRNYNTNFIVLEFTKSIHKEHPKKQTDIYKVSRLIYKLINNIIDK